MQATELTNSNTVFSSSLNRIFSWFGTNFLSNIESVTKDFWNIEAKYRLIAIFDNGENPFKGEDFFVTRIKHVNTGNDILIKLSMEACGLLLENSLGEGKSVDFSFDTMTGLEGKIISEFGSSLVNSFMPLFLKESKQDTLKDLKYDLVFYIKGKNDKIGKLIVSIPKCIITPEEVKLEEFKFDVREFAKTLTTVSIFVGSSKTTLNELKYLDKGDIVVLENSRLNKMTLKVNEEVKTIKVNPNPSLIINVEENEVETMSANLSKDMWDTIQVEIGAEFDKIKISLGELKQISEGLVVDIGSVYENKIDLKVENRIIAKGELVIINDRYGIRIDKVFKQEKLETEKISTNLAETKVDDMEEEVITDDNETDESDDDFLEEDEFSDFDVDDEDL